MKKRRIFITGSSDGLGLLAGRLLAEQGHSVVLHARNETKAHKVQEKLPSCEAVIVGDVATISEMKSVATQANALGRFDAVIHNVAIGTSEQKVLTSDGITSIFAVNVVAPYVLTALMQRPERLVFMSSGMHASGDEHLADPQWQKKSWSSTQAYSDTKLYDLMLALFLARQWPEAYVNAVHPGWVPTRMGGRGAPDDLSEGANTQAWLAVSDEPEAMVSGQYFYHKKKQTFKTAASNPANQERLIHYLQEITQLKLS